MPLLDHFRPPLSGRRHWHSFHNSWATYLAADLNRQLPAGYFAEANVQFGIEIDVAAYEEGTTAGPGGWSPPAPTATIPYSVTTDQIEVLLYHQEGGPRLAGAVEFVSPRNKDRATARDAFVSKCVAYLSQSLGLFVVDVVTERHANLHAELLARLGSPGATAAPELYATAYRRVEHDGAQTVDVWLESLAIGQPLPTLPLWLPGGLCLAVELEASYTRTCQEQRVILNGT